MFVSVIIVAAGMGTRISSDRPKQYIEINGKPIIAYTLGRFESCAGIDEIIVVADDPEYFCEAVVKKHKYTKLTGAVKGGDCRQASVYNGLLCIAPHTDIVLVHDGVRPFVSHEDIAAVIRGADKYGSCVPGVKVTDTIKVCDGDFKILQTPDRSNLWAVQTPQGFKREILKTAYEQAISGGFCGTDDASLVERTGHAAYITQGSYDNIKITTDKDLDYIKWIFERRANS